MSFGHHVKRAMAEKDMAKTDDETPVAPAVVGLSPEQLKDILAAVGQTNADAMKRSLKPENETAAPNSVYHPLGTTKHSLRRETFFCGVRQREDQLTPGEVDDFNAIAESIEIPDGHGGLWEARLERNGSHERLFVSVPAKDSDMRQNLPNPPPNSSVTGLQMILRALKRDVAVPA